MAVPSRIFLPHRILLPRKWFLPHPRIVFFGPSQTQIGLTGGGKDDHMIHLSGLPHHKVATEKIIEEVVSLVEQKSKEIQKN